MRRPGHEGQKNIEIGRLEKADMMEDSRDTGINRPNELEVHMDKPSYTI